MTFCLAHFGNPHSQSLTTDFGFPARAEKPRGHSLTGGAHPTGGQLRDPQQREGQRIGRGHENPQVREGWNARLRLGTPTHRQKTAAGPGALQPTGKKNQKKKRAREADVFFLPRPSRVRCSFEAAEQKLLPSESTELTLKSWRHAMWRAAVLDDWRLLANAPEQIRGERGDGWLASSEQRPGLEQNMFLAEATVFVYFGGSRKRDGLDGGLGMFQQGKGVPSLRSVRGEKSGNQQRDAQVVLSCACLAGHWGCNLPNPPPRAQHAKHVPPGGGGGLLWMVAKAFLHHLRNAGTSLCGAKDFATVHSRVYVATSFF